MTTIEFVSLDAVPESALMALMNHEKVRAYLPLLSGDFSAVDCQAFLDAKRAMWADHGYGPWAILIGGEFAGWGGVQPEQGDADFGLVLHPDFWGWGRRVFEAVKARAFGEMGLTSITALLPPSRPNSRAILRLGFVADGALDVDGERFLRFRLYRDDC